MYQPCAISTYEVILPQSFKISQVYYACFVEVFGVSPDLSTQVGWLKKMLLSCVYILLYFSPALL